MSDAKAVNQGKHKSNIVPPPFWVKPGLDVYTVTLGENLTTSWTEANVGLTLVCLSDMGTLTVTIFQHATVLQT